MNCPKCGNTAVFVVTGSDLYFGEIKGWFCNQCLWSEEDGFTTRQEVYEVIDGERLYQDNLSLGPDGRTDWREKSVGDYLTLIREYSRRADESYAGNPGDTPALHMVRKIAGICVQCLEVHGAPPR